MHSDPQPIILYDGPCGLCDAGVRWVLRRDKQARFRFAALQSEIAASLLADHGADPLQRETVVLLIDRRALQRSDAVLAVLAQLPRPWRAFRFFRFCPRFLRDAVYDFIARHRRRWFGRYESCPLAPARYRERFLDRAEIEEA